MQGVWRGGVVVWLSVCVVGGPAVGGTMDPVEVGSVRGETIRNMLVSDGYAYCAGRTALTVYDVQDPSRPNLVGKCEDPAPRWSYGVTQLGRYLYVPVYGEATALRVYDVADPADPVHVGSYYVGEIGQVYVHGGYGYAVTPYNVVILDLSDPSHPTEANWYYDESIHSGARVAFSGDYAYFADFGGHLTVVSVADPLHPTHVTWLEIAEFVSNLVVSGDHLFLGFPYVGLQIFDISDPSAPVAVGSLSDPLWWTEGLVVSGDYAFLVEAEVEQSRIRVVDVSDPANPEGVLSYETGRRLGGLVLDGKTIYASVCSLGFRAFDISDPLAIEEVSHFTNPGIIRAVKTAGGKAYLSDWEAIYAVDITSPEAPEVMGAYPTSWWYDLAAVTADGYAYCTRGSEPVHGLRILDFSDPANPTEASRLYAGLDIGPVAVSGQRAYAVDNDNWVIHILDVSDPHAPQEIGSFDAQAWHESNPDATRVTSYLAASGNYVYALTAEGVHGIDATDPLAPVDHLGTGWYGEVRAWTLSGKYIYLAEGGMGLGIVDISEPSAPRLLGVFPIDEPAPGLGGVPVADVAVSGCYAYLTTEAESLLVVDVSDPTAPVWVGSYPVPRPYYEMQIAASGRDALLGECGTGLIVLRNPAPFADIPSAWWAYDEIAACREAGIATGYWDETYRPAEVVTRAEVAVFVSRGLAGGDAGVPAGPATATFSDVPTGNWAYRYVEYALAEGVVSGYGDGTYRPALTVDRAEVAVFAARARAGGDAGVPEDPDGTAFFPDVPETHWAYRHIEYCHDQGVVEGYWDGYHPEEAVDRAQMAVYVQRAFGLAM